MSETEATSPAAALASTWAGQLSEVLLSMAGERPRFSSEPASAEELSRPDMRWSQHEFSIGSGGVLWVGAAEATWAGLGQRVLRAAGIDTPELDEAGETYAELVTQAVAGLARRMSADTATEVDCRPGSPVSGTPAPSEQYRVEVIFEGSPALPLCIGFNSSFLEAAIRAANPPSVPAVQTPSTPNESESAVLSSGSKMFDVLLDVEVPVRVSFGSAHVPIQDVLKLTTGSIVELDRSIAEPVDIIVNNCVIARGEVVVIEGNYGVRIGEITSRKERLRTTAPRVLPSNHHAPVS